MIDRLELENFTVFRDLKVDFSSKINLIIGENGTGKTHLLKAAYALCAGNASYVDRGSVSQEELESTLTGKLVRVFLPLEDKLWKLRSSGATDYARMRAAFAFDKGIAVTFHTNSKTVALQSNDGYEQYSWQPVFIPTKEVLSFMKGFNSLYEKFGLRFDQTYQDICLALDLPEIRPERLHAKAKWAMDEITEICGGRFVFHGGGHVTFKSEGTEYSVNVMAEGFRKAGILSRLLETGTIQPGGSGPLFWDEPEANFNPKLTKQLVSILLELSRNGQQIVIATHDYFIMKWFDLLAKESEGDHIFYHALFKDPDTQAIGIETVDDYRLINANAIADTFSEVYDAELDRSMGANTE